MFGGLGLQGQPDGYSVINMFEGSFIEEVTGAGKAFFEEGFKFSTPEERNKFDGKASAYWGAIEERSGGDWGASGCWQFMRNKK